MRRSDEPAALSRIAADAGLSLSDVAFIAELDESTVSRLWADPAWLDRVTGSSLQRMIASVPGVAEYVTVYSLTSRLSRLINELADEGLIVDQTALEACRSDGVPVPYIANAMQAALHAMRGDDATVVSYLARFWGRDQDKTLERLFSDSSKRLLANPERLLAASAELTPRLRRPGYSFHSILAEAALVHHARQASGEAPDLSEIRDRRAAMTLRSTVMGLLIKRNELDLAQHYERVVDRSPTLALIEEWAFPTYARDARPEPGFTLPRSLLLRNTAAEVIREIDSYSDAYVHYLLSVYVPLALSRDPTFGLQLPRLKKAINRRLSRGGDARLSMLCEHMLHDLEGVTGE